MNITGIYKIQSKIKPERIYIGSAINIKSRWSYHLSCLKRNVHHSKKLQRHYNKYGKDDLMFEIITQCDKDNVIAMEQFYIDAFNLYFNNCKIAGSLLGYRFSEDAKKKMSERMKGNRYLLGHKHSPETIQKLKLAHQNISDELREKYRITSLGRKHSEETKKKIGEGNKGKTITKEQREKISLSRLGKYTGKKNPFYNKNHTEETKLKISNANTGRRHKHTEEAKKKISEAKRKRDALMKIKLENISHGILG